MLRRPGSGFPCFASHDDGFAGGVGFEEGEIFGDVPRNCTPVAQHAVLRDGGNQGDFHGFPCPRRLRSPGSCMSAHFMMPATSAGFNS